jgi:mannose/cellobiose epimerase-like protein (N-acyl-D-glucosamine 2-epimerase family)
VNEVPRTTDDLRRWLLSGVVPWWRTRALDRASGGYHEVLATTGEPRFLLGQTTLVTARLVYVFAHAQILAPDPATLAAARHGFRFLIERLWDPVEGGFYGSVDRDGRPLDPRMDAYDTAFVLFACAWLARATGEEAPLDCARRTVEALDRRLADRTAGGWAMGGWDEHTGAAGRPQPRRQNPHMHLLEAFHALYETSGEAVWLDRARGIVELCRTHFAAAGSLGEYFTADWQPAAGAPGQLREPGHHFEWTWLLHHHHRLTGDPSTLVLADRLYGFAIAHGMDEADPALVFDGLDPAGVVLADTKLFWPQTEAIKAFAARWELRGDRDALERCRRHIGLIFRHYLDRPTGLWRNQLDRAGREVSTEIPVRVLYHLFLCFAEAIRVDVLGAGES